MKINNTEAIRQTGINHDTFNTLIKKYPNLLVLLRKGLVAEKYFNAEVLEDLINLKRKTKCK